MAGWKFSFVRLALSLILLGLCCDASDEGQAGEESKANQGFYYFGPPQPQFRPPQFQPRPQARPRPQPQRIPYYPYYPPPPRPPPRRLPLAPPRRSPSFDISSFITYYYFIRSLFQTTAAPTTTAAPKVVQVCVGSWGEWGECSKKCAGTQSRKHSCTGVVQYQPCNGPKVQDNGWYRASNCYEYYLNTLVSTDDTSAQTACEAFGTASLAAVGMRNTTVRREIMSALYDNILSPIQFYIGLKRVMGTWTWSDTNTETPNLWDAGEPGANDCVQMTLGNAQSGEDVVCTVDRRGLCERKIT